MNRVPFLALALLRVSACFCMSAPAQVAVRGETVYTMAGPPIMDGVVLMKEGKIAAVGRADQIDVPEGFKVLRAKVRQFRESRVDGGITCCSGHA